MFDDIAKILVVLLITNLLILFGMPFFFANYELQINAKPIEIRQQEQLENQINRLENENQELALELSEVRGSKFNPLASAIAAFSGVILVLGAGTLLYKYYIEKQKLELKKPKEKN